MAFSGGSAPTCTVVSDGGFVSTSHCVVTVAAGNHSFIWTFYWENRVGIPGSSFNAMDDLLIASISVQDNCPSLANADQLNTDGDTCNAM